MDVLDYMEREARPLAAGHAPSKAAVIAAALIEASARHAPA